MGWFGNILGKLGGAIGLAVGFFLGAPALGYAIGSFIGATFGDRPVPRGPALGDIAEQTAREGGARPIVFGLSKPIAGNIIWKRPLTKRWVKKDGYEVETPFRTYAVGICEGPISGFVRVWRNGKKVFDIEDPEFTATNFSIAALSGLQLLALSFGLKAPSILAAAFGTKNSTFLSKVRLYNGAYDQTADPLMIQDHGAQACAHQGTAYMVVIDEDETDVGGAVPEWTFQVLAGETPLAYGEFGVVREVFDSGISTVRTFPEGVNKVRFLVVGAGARASNYYGNPGAGGEVVDAYVELRDDRKVGIQVANGTWPSNDPTSIGVYNNSKIRYFDGTSVVEGAITAKMGSGGLDESVLTPGANGAGMAVTGWEGWGTGFGWHGYYVRGSGVSYLVEERTPPNAGNYYKDGLERFPLDRGLAATLGPSTASDELFVRRYGGNTGGRACFHVNSRSNVSIYYGGSGGAGSPGGDAEIGKHGEAGSGVNLGSIFGYDLGANGVFGAGAKKGDPTPPQNSGCGSATADPIYGVVVALYYNPEVWSGIDDPANTTTLRSVIKRICNRRGIPDDRLDLSDGHFDQPCDGITVTFDYPAAEAINALCGAFQFDVAEVDNKLVFVPRGGDAVATITEGDMVDDDADIDDVTRSDSISIPRVLHLLHCDTDAGILNASKQTSERVGDARSMDEVTLETPVLMGKDKAAQLVSIMHSQVVEEAKGQLRFALPEKWAWLTPTNPIVVQFGGQSVRARIQECEILDGFQNYVAVRDRQSAYTSNVQGLPAPSRTETFGNVPGPSLLVPLDIPLLQDIDDRIGYYVAVSGVLPSWSGASIEMSRDGGSTYLAIANTRRPATIGALADDLPDHPRDYPDVTHQLRVRLLTPGATLAAASFADLLNRRNLAAIGSPSTGWELVSFAEVSGPVDGVWTLTTLLRGRRGTESRNHEVAGGDAPMFVLLDLAALQFIEVNATDLGAELTLRATSYGDDPDEQGSVVSIESFTSATRIERAPGNVRARRDGDDIIVSWHGVARLGPGKSPIHGVGFAGYRVTFDDGVATVSVDTETPYLTQDVSGLTAGPITVSVAQLNSLTGAGPVIEVIV